MGRVGVKEAFCRKTLDGTSVLCGSKWAVRVLLISSHARNSFVYGLHKLQVEGDIRQWGPGPLPPDLFTVCFNKELPRILCSDLSSPGIPSAAP